MAFSATRRTQQQPPGLPGRKYGSFAGRVLSAIGDVILATVGFLGPTKRAVGNLTPARGVLSLVARRTAEKL